MKTTLNLRTASVAIAVSLASTSVQAQESTPVLSVLPTLDVVIAQADPDRPTAAGAQISALNQGAITIADAFAPIELQIPQLAAPMVIEPDLQQAIYSVEFTEDARGELVVARDPIIAPLQTDIALLSEPAAIEGEAQQAIFDVNFAADAGDLVSVQGPIAANYYDRVVTARSIDPFYGDIDAFYGDIVAFYGDIDAFWGDINPFYGDIDAFYGDIGAFWGDISPFYGDIGAFWGDIDAFYGDIGAFYGDIGAFTTHVHSIGAWGKAAKQQIATVESNWSALKYTTNPFGTVNITFDGTPDRIRNSLEALIQQAEAQFGAAYTAKTGKSFRDGFVAEILAKHGLNLDNTTAAKLTLAKNKGQRAAFFLDWNDSLMQYSGIDQVDHWMAAVNWTPSITQIQGEGKQAIVGIIDGSFAADADLADNVVWAGGGTTTVNGHGAGVASLIAGAHDGEGIMGIAPKVKIAAYNPFDANHKASWDSVANGIQSLLFKYVGGNDTGYVSVINMSLGEKGHVFSQGMADVLNRPYINAWSHETTYVIAAGNDGITQTSDVNWNGFQDTNFILVGSIDPNGEISKFSNRPGNACLLTNGVCGEGNRLMDRFIVAPGTMLLVSDGQGGVHRASGTSFAAPLVSGAVTLLHDRWKWLVRHPEETTEIIFRSARDLGAPGVDAVYGHGLLDVAASQSPLDFGAMTFNLYNGSGALKKAVTVDSLLSGGVPQSWDTDGVFFTAFEYIGDTYRDFLIPMSSLQQGQQSSVLGHGQQYMQDFISDRFANWLLSNGADKDGDGKLGVTQVRSNEAETSGQWTMRYDAMAPRFTQDGAVRPVHNAATLTTPDGKASFTLGHGQGALALSGGQFGIMSDHDAETGGVNPVLGLASGEMFGGASYNIAEGTKVSVGFSAEREDWEDLDTGNEMQRQLQRQLGAREAQALTVAIDQNITDRLSVGVQFTHLNEEDALLGMQTGNDALLGDGSRTDAMTASASFDAGNGLSFDLSVTGGATRTDDGQFLATSQRALSSAGQFAVNKRGVINARDILRVSVGQPLTVERGQLEFTSDQVVDRETGATAAVTQVIGIDTKRRLTSEFVYATPVADDAEFGLIGRYISAGEIGQEESFMIGANFGLRF